MRKQVGRRDVFIKEYTDIYDSQAISCADRGGGWGRGLGVDDVWSLLIARGGLSDQM